MAIDNEIDSVAAPGIVQEAGRRISWAAVFAGAVVALVVQLMLSVLGIGIGASTINPLTEQNPADGIGIGAGIWFVLTSLIALFAGGWVAGYLAAVWNDADRMLHGILAWGLTMLFTFYLVTSTVSGLIGGTANVIGRGASAVDADSGVVSRAENAADSVANRLPSEERVREIGNTAASGITQAGIWTFVFMLVGAVAAAFGGYSSKRPQREFDRRVDVARVRTT